MSATLKEINECKEVLRKIHFNIPVRGYVKMVQNVFKEKNLPIPDKYRIQSVRNSRTYDIKIAKALQIISKTESEEF